MMDRELHMQTAIVGLAQAAFSRISEWISVSCIVARATALYCLAAVVWGICITPRVLYNLSRILCPCRSPLQNFNFIYDLYTPYSIYRPKWTGFILLFYLARHQVFSGSYTSDSLPRATSYTIRLVSRRPRRGLRPVYKVGNWLWQVSERTKSHWRWAARSTHCLCLPFRWDSFLLWQYVEYTYLTAICVDLWICCTVQTPPTWVALFV